MVRVAQGATCIVIGRCCSCALSCRRSALRACTGWRKESRKGTSQGRQRWCVRHFSCTTITHHARMNHMAVDLRSPGVRSCVCVLLTCRQCRLHLLLESVHVLSDHDLRAQRVHTDAVPSVLQRRCDVDDRLRREDRRCDVARIGRQTGRARQAVVGRVELRQAQQSLHVWMHERGVLACRLWPMHDRDDFAAAAVWVARAGRIGVASHERHGTIVERAVGDVHAAIFGVRDWSASLCRAVRVVVVCGVVGVCVVGCLCAGGLWGGCSSCARAPRRAHRARS